ncbi:MAG: haloacid dehalogenase-like hydrolase [Dokdonella sp.]
MLRTNPGEGPISTGLAENDDRDIRDFSIGSAAEPASAAGIEMPRVVLFDFDGVLVRDDLFESFLRNRFRRQPWRLMPMLPLLPALLLLCIVPTGRRLLINLFVRLGLSGSRLAKLEPELARWGRARARLPGVVMRDGVVALRRHVANGDRVVVVTGCEAGLARGLLDELALGDIEVIGSQLRDGWLGARPRVHVIGRRKIPALAERGIVAPWAIAYSDSSRDTPMLKGATEAIIVNMDARNRKRVERRLGRKLEWVSWR